jgi:hypothetical protein
MRNEHEANMALQQTVRDRLALMNRDTRPDLEVIDRGSVRVGPEDHRVTRAGHKVVPWVAAACVLAAVAILRWS